MQTTDSKFNKIYQEELSQINARIEGQKNRWFEEVRQHARECREKSCSRCEYHEGLYPEIVAGVRAKRRLAEAA